MKTNTVTRNKFLKFIIGVLFILIIIIVTIVAIYLDCEYYKVINNQSNNQWVIEKIETARKYNISYSFAYDLLRGSFGMVLTIISIILTLSYNIANRSEAMVYGIARLELNEGILHIVYNMLRITIFLVPIAIFFAINLKLCITGYTLLFIVYIYLVLSYWLHSTSYSKKRESALVCKKLFEIFRDSYEKTNENRMEYQGILENLRISTEKDGYWINTENLYFQIIMKILEKPDEETCFGMSYYFFDIVFVQGRKKQEKNILRVFEKILDYLDSIVVCKNDKRKYVHIILGAMICSIYRHGTEEIIVEISKGFFDFGKRGARVLSKQKPTSKIKSLDKEELDYQAGILLIWFEYWLQDNTYTSQEFLIYLKLSWDYGKFILEKENVRELDWYIELCNRYAFNKEYIEKKYVENLKVDYNIKIGKSCTYSLIK